MDTVDYLLEFEEEDQPREYVSSVVMNLLPDAGARIAIALERIAAALERAYPPVGAEESQ